MRAKPLCLCGLLLLTGCGSANELKKNLGLDMTTVSAFAIGAAASGSTGQGLTSVGQGLAQRSWGETAQTDQLYVLDTSGNLTVVNITQGESTTIEPHAIFDTPHFVFFALWRVRYQGEDCHLVALRKADAALYCVPASYGVGWYGGTEGVPSIFVQTDGPGDVAYVKHDGALARLELAGTAPTRATLIAHPNELGDSYDPNTRESANAFAVNGAGEALVLFADVSSTFLRIYKRSATPQALLGFTGGACLSGGPGNAPDDFFFLGTKTADSASGVYRIPRNADGSFGAPQLYADLSSGSPATAGCKVLLKTNDRIVVQFGGEPGSSGAVSLFELVNPSQTFAQRTIPGMPSTPKIFAYAETLYLTGMRPGDEFAVLRYNLVTEQTDTLLTTTSYFGITAVDVAPTGDVQFSARRASDAQRVLVTLSAGSDTPQETVTDTAAPVVKALTRIQ